MSTNEYSFFAKRKKSMLIVVAHNITCAGHGMRYLGAWPHVSLYACPAARMPESGQRGKIAMEYTIGGRGRD